MLAGVAISSMLTGATTLLQYFADEVALSSLVFWTFATSAVRTGSLCAAWRWPCWC